MDSGRFGGIGGGSTQSPPMFSTVKAYLTRPSTYVLIVIGVVIAFAYSRFVPGIVKDAAAKLPGAQ